MKQVFAKKGRVQVEEVTVPVCGDNEVKVKVLYSVISSGTELNTVKKLKQPLYQTALEKKELVKSVIIKAKKEGYFKTYNYVKQMLNNWWRLGYSCSGKVMEVGKNVREFSVNDDVACGGQNYASHAEIVCVPKNLVVKIPKNVSLKEASLTTIGSIAIQSVRRLNPSFGEIIVVYGLGLLGQIVCQILSAIGCQVIGIDINEKRAKKAKVHRFFTTDFVKNAIHFTKGIGVDGVIISAATDNKDIINNSMEMCRKKGRVVLLGKVPITINREVMYKKELDFLISTSYGPGRYDKDYEEKGQDYPLGYVRWTENRNMQEFLRLLAERKISVEELIEKEFSIDEAEEAYLTLSKANPVPLIVLLSYPQELNKEEPLRLVTSNKKIVGKINVGLIGAGNFAKGTHLVNVKKIDDFNLKAIVTKNPGSAKNLALLNGAEYCSADYTEVLNDKDIHLVVISTRHNLHAKIAIEALKKGKQVFVEKPMGITREECRSILNTLKGKGLVYSVGFNRNYAPLTQQVKSFFETRDYPLIINYRVNTKPTGREDWVNDPEEGGGRIIGEMCHMFSFFNYIIGTRFSEINAYKINSDGRVIDSNNAAVTIKYGDGSVATLVYTDYANDTLSKERIEIFGGGNVAVLDDFEQLFINGKKSSIKQDKGHYAELVELLKKLRGEKSELIDANKAYESMEICFRVEEILNGNFNVKN
ncbi:bi-domain-containing oxidoreductase [Candidatus Woesearchaeota archaeon]|nr:bi-domain-containing oxidoreductase [Candidatus Woesearchaeota archaeon]